MKEENILSRDILLTEGRAQADAACKKLLANKIILAWIMKHSMEEYRVFEVEYIAEHFIEGDPVIGETAVHQDEEDLGRVTGIGTENSSIKEGTVTYDIRFRAIYPGTGELIPLIINVEAQEDFSPGYPLVKRGIYYGSRMISSQYGTEFTSAHYEKIKKVYSIWICMNPPQYRQNSVMKYSISESHIMGADTPEKKENYDLMTVILICLGEKKTANEKMLGMLNTLLSKRQSAEEKKRILTEKYHIKMTKDLETEVTQMCNYGDYVYNQGMQQGVLLGKTEITQQMIFEELGNLGEIPESLRARIMQEKDIDVLKNMVKKAISADSLEEFAHAI